METADNASTPLPKDSEAPADKTKVFISYSRQDSSFVVNLVDALKQHGSFHVFQDTSDILPSEEWKTRLEKLIGEADTIVFCLSPASAASEVCAWEVQVAESLNKRIVPVVIQEVEGDVPGGLEKLDYTFFTDDCEFGQSIDRLVTALQTDIPWIREHTRIGELARRWERTKAKDQLFRGTELAFAEQWAKYRPSVAPELTENMLAFLKASRDEAFAGKWRQRRNAGLVTSMFLAAGAAWATQDHWLPILDVTYYWARNLTSDTNSTGQVFRDCTNCPEMVVIPPGKFLMGTPGNSPSAPPKRGSWVFDHRRYERPQHPVTIRYAFAVSKFELTFDQWDKCVASGGCDHHAADQNYGRGNRPAIGISWAAAKQYATWLTRLTGNSYRLLSEAEWEYSARAGSTTLYSWGDKIGKGNANCHGCGSKWDSQSTAPVGSFKPNAFGLYDMHGNVAEWVEDTYNWSYKGAPSDGSAWVDLIYNSGAVRVIRGGSFITGPDKLRSAFRHGISASTSVGPQGFRVARDLAP